MPISRKPSFLRGLSAVDSQPNLSDPASPSENKGPQQNQKMNAVATKILNPLQKQPVDRDPTPLQGHLVPLQVPKPTRLASRPTHQVTIEPEPFTDHVVALQAPKPTSLASRPRHQVTIEPQPSRSPSPTFEAMMVNNPYRKLPSRQEFHPDSSSMYLPGTIGHRCATALSNGKPLP